MGKQNNRNITAKELLALLPLNIIEQKATETKVDRNVKKLFGRDMFYLLLLSVLDSERSSLRIIQNLYSSGKFTLLAGVTEGSSTSFTSFSDRLMFRFLKQELNLKHFVSYSLNVIKVWLYVLLIAAMLIMVYKKLNGISSYKRAKRLFVETIDNEITRLIVEICGGNPDLTPILNST